MSDRQLVAVVAVIVRDGRVLAMKRARDKDAGAGLWETLSGRVRPGEDPHDAVCREIREESGLETRVEPLPFDVYTARRNDEPMIVLVYRADYVSGEVQRSIEHDDHAWWTAEEFSQHSRLVRLVTSVRRALAPRP